MDEQTLREYPLWMMVRMLNPSVGETSLVSSSSMYLTIVVFPALSSPLQPRSDEERGGESGTNSMRILICFSLRRVLRMMVSSPI